VSTKTKTKNSVHEEKKANTANNTISEPDSPSSSHAKHQISTPMPNAHLGVETVIDQFSNTSVDEPISAGVLPTRENVRPR